ncbi:hypothetical protein [Natronomonas gomsonensis]|uniref:hypothetical protein n=1 Tax=Natronomonas gomsonensis TaxID=1046043 RepID=UPI0015C0CB29|nr:hypothetical protein [Natronomonas gomsonensis]
MSHTRGTFAALVDALVPETPDLADRGDEHVPGGLAVGLEEEIIDRVNNFQEADGALAAAGYDATPMAPAVAVLLDTAAAELLVRRRSANGFNSPAEEFAGGPFSRLSRQDRLRALRLLEDEGVFPRLADRFDSAALGTIQFLASSLPILVEFVYYSEVTADDGEERSLGWRQADYPGPADGYAVGMGYEVEEFEENEY